VFLRTKRSRNEMTSWKDQFCRFVALDLAQDMGEGIYETNLPEIYGTAASLTGWLAADVNCNRVFEK
jgi:hypothetical protein